MGETEYDVLSLVQRLVDLGGHSHMFCFFPERGSLMDHLPATPRDQWRRVQLARYLIDYRGVRVDHMRFDEEGRVVDFGLPKGELDDIVSGGRRVPHLRLPRQVCRGHFGLRSALWRLAAEQHRQLSLPAEQDRSAQDPQATRHVGERALMTRSFRVIDTGVREGRANIAFDAALIDPS